MARLRTPSAPSSMVDIMTFVLGVSQLYDADGNPVAIPDLTLQVNPQDMDFQYKKIVTRTRTRAGWFEEHWGDELDVMTCSASTGTFFDINAGLSIDQRYQTLSMINFRELFSLFKNNACVYDSNGAILTQGLVSITFDNFQFFGQFSTFGWDEDETVPYRFSFNFTFEVKNTVVGI